MLQFSGAVEETAAKTGDATVQLRLDHNGHFHPLASRSTVFAGASSVGLALFLCNESPGAQDVELQAQATGAPVVVGNRSLAIAETVPLP